MISVLVIVRNDSKPSRKASFVIQLFRSNVNNRIFYVFRRNVFIEKWDKNQVELAASTSAIIAYYWLKVFQSPSDIRDAALRRLFGRTIAYSLINEGFLSTLSVPLNQCFIPSRTATLLALLKKTNSEKIFLIDEFVSINIINLKILKKLGKIIYVSQDVGYNHFGYAERSFSRNLIYKLEKNAVCLADLVIACSEMERQIYLEMGAKKAIFYPNIYPIAEFEPSSKDETPSVSIVLPEHWGTRAEQSLNEIFEALSHVKRNIKVFMIGIKPKQVASNIELEYHKKIPNELDYLKTLSKSWIGINIGIHMGGTNQKKYDYAMAGLVVLSDKLGVRGDLLPCEYAYADNHDLVAKLQQLLEFGKKKLQKMGVENRIQTLSLAEKQKNELLRAVKAFDLTDKQKTA